MKKILLCDDDLDISTLMEVIVSSMGLDFVAVNEIRDIEGLVLTEKPDLILMDLWIPQIGGEKAVKLLKSNDQLAKIPILMFSATDQLKALSIKIKADGYVQKPFDVADFKSKIEDMVYSRA